MIDFYIKSKIIQLSSGRIIEIKRIGIKYFFLLNAYLIKITEEISDVKNYQNVLNLLQKFTNQNLRILNQNEIKEIIEEIFKFNIRNKSSKKNFNNFNNKKFTLFELNQIHDSLMAILIEKTGWTDKYISENISFFQAQQLLEEWKKTRVEKINDTAIAVSVPYGAKLDEYINSILGIEEVNLQEFLFKMKTEKEYN